ncbi:MAG: hypothetical protein AAFQ02_11650 [Bacteroidota bacterium]
MIFAFGVAGILADQSVVRVYLLSMLTYAVFCTIIFGYGRRLVATRQGYTFTGIVSISFIAKLIMAIGSIWLYERLYHPTESWHVVHYLVCYAAYTVYEVHFLTKLGKVI